VEKCCRAGQDTDDNITLDTQGYKHTLRTCITYCLFTATLVTRTLLNITLYLHCLSCMV